MNAQQLLIISAMNQATYRVAQFFEAIKDNLDDLQEEVSKLDNDSIDESALDQASDEFYMVRERAEEAALSLWDIVKDSIGENDFFDSLSSEEKIFLDNQWSRLYHPESILFSSKWATEWLPIALKNEVDQALVRDIYQRGLDWFETHLH